MSHRVPLCLYLLHVPHWPLHCSPGQWSTQTWIWTPWQTDTSWKGQECCFTSNLWFRNSTTNLLFFCFSMLWAKMKLWSIPDHRGGWFVGGCLPKSSCYQSSLLPMNCSSASTIAPTFPSQELNRVTEGSCSLNIREMSVETSSSATPRKATVLKTFIQYIFDLHSWNFWGQAGVFLAKDLVRR